MTRSLVLASYHDIIFSHVFVISKGPRLCWAITDSAVGFSVSLLVKMISANIITARYHAKRLSHSIYSIQKSGPGVVRVQNAMD
jgi:hypothetical protein